MYLSGAGNRSDIPRPFRFLNGLVVRAAVDLLPPEVRELLGLTSGFELPPGARSSLSLVARRLDRLHLQSTPASLACLRLGLPANYLSTGR